MRRRRGKSGSADLSRKFPDPSQTPAAWTEEVSTLQIDWFNGEATPSVPCGHRPSFPPICNNITITIDYHWLIERCTAVVGVRADSIAHGGDDREAETSTGQPRLYLFLGVPRTTPSRRQTGGCIAGRQPWQALRKWNTRAFHGAEWVASQREGIVGVSFVMHDAME